MKRPANFWRSLVVAFSSFGFEEVYSQSSSFETLSIDRPDVSNLPTTVRPGHYQFETGIENASSSLTHEFYLPNLLFRTGLNSKTELRLGFNELKIDSLDGRVFDDILYFSVGGKFRFVEENGWIPSIAIQPEFSLPFGDGAAFKRDYPNYNLADYSVVLLFNNTLHKQVFLNYNAGVFWSSKGRVDYLISASASFLHTHRLGYFLESYALLEERHQYPLSFDGGLMFLLWPRFQIDIYGGNRGVENHRFWFWGAGVGFRVDQGDLSRREFDTSTLQH